MHRKAKGSTTVSVNLTVAFADVAIMPPNPRRCGLIVSATNGQAAISFDGSRVADGATITGGQCIGTSRTALVLGEDAVYGVLNGEIHAAADGGVGIRVAVTEIFYME